MPLSWMMKSFKPSGQMSNWECVWGNHFK
jgi:hypothetical protein